MKIKMISVFLFLCLLLLGYYLSIHKPLWNDEIYSQRNVIGNMSYWKLWAFNIGEGNNAPLFYTLQKAITQTLNFEFPDHYQGEWFFLDQKSQKMMRLLPNVLMSLTLLLIFVYFSKVYSLGLGLYSMLVASSSAMIWFYWAEARPYGMWMFFSTVQLLLTFHILKTEDNDQKSWIWLGVVNILFSLTIVVSLVQSVCCSMILWLFKSRDWKKWVSILIIPFFISVLYYVMSDKYNFHVPKNSFHLILHNLSIERIFFLLIMSVICLRTGVKSKDLIGGYVYLGCMFAFAVLLLAMFLNFQQVDAKGFVISHRYFIFLTPINIIMVTLASGYLWKWTHDKGDLRATLIVGLSGLLFIDYLYTWHLLTNALIY